MSQKARTIWTVLIVAILLTPIGYWFLRQSADEDVAAPSPTPAVSASVPRYGIWIADEAWKNADAVYFFQITGTEKEREDTWKRAYRKVYDGWHREHLTVMYGYTTDNKEFGYYMFVVGFRVPLERKEELPQFLSPDPPMQQGGRIAGCGWLKAR